MGGMTFTATHAHIHKNGGDMRGGASNYYYSDNISGKSYSLLLGACRLGLEELVYATLELKSMQKINAQQVR